jgi:hypothetical protein
MSELTKLSESEIEEKAQRNEQFNNARALQISKSKMIGKSKQTDVPYGIMDILHYNKTTGKTEAFSGQTTPNCNVLIMLPVRIIHSKVKYALFSQPAEWKLKFYKGQQVYIITNEKGYVQKLIPATNMASSNPYVDPSTISDSEESLTSTEENRSMSAPEPQAVVETETGPSASGFEDAEDNMPF